MTDRTINLTVALDREYRDDDAQAIIDAIKMIKGVQYVSHIVFDSTDQSNAWCAERKFKMDIVQKLLKILES